VRLTETETDLSLEFLFGGLEVSGQLVLSHPEPADLLAERVLLVVRLLKLGHGGSEVLLTLGKLGLR
jgi:hypothetical protein